MTNPNDKVWDLVSEKIGGLVVNVVGRKAQDIRKNVERELQGYTDKTWGHLASLMGDGIPTGIPGTENWQSHAPDYADRVYRMGSYEFYYYTGKLKKFTADLNANAVLGKPIVKFSDQKGLGQNPNFFVDKGGRTQIRLPSGRTQFASVGDAYKNLSFTIQVDLFPKINGKSVGSLMSQFPRKMAWNEFGAKRKRNTLPARPLVGPFLEWYSGKNLRDEMTRIVREV